MSGGDVAELRAALAARIRDVPDYPKPGVLFKDITPILADAELFPRMVDELARPWRSDGDGPPAVDKVVGIEARGFILAAPVALALGVGFVPVRKQGKLPAETYSESYSLEYGEETLEMHCDAFGPGERAVIVDDVLATGGTAAATSRLVERAGGSVVGLGVLLELTFLEARKRLESAARPLTPYALLSV